MPDYNVKQLTRILTDFYTLTHLRIGVLDISTHERFSYPKSLCPFCAMIRQNAEWDAKCQECDNDAFKRCKSQKTAQIYTCHAGMIEAIIPVVSSGIVLCYVMFGQVIDEATAAETKEKMRSMFYDERQSREELNSVIDQIDIRNMKEIMASATILDALASYFINEQLISVGTARFANLLNTYIEAHMSEPILVSDLCKYFGISRTRLYEIAQMNLNCSISSYIQKQRIQYAEHLLRTTSLSSMDIAAAAGFSDYNYFSRVFKKLTGKSARAYRKAAGPRPSEEANAISPKDT